MEPAHDGRPRVLVVNAGSSSVKLRLLQRDEVLERTDVSVAAGDVDAATIAKAIEGWSAPDVIGHRVVHGGTRYTEPVVVDADVRRELQSLTALAPLHQPGSLAALDAVSRLFPNVPSVACFDTAFHATMSPHIATYPIPRQLSAKHSIRRYGFHGLSHAYASRRAATMVGRPLEELRIVTCHLGSGASLAAVAGGRSVDTTMGFTPLDGLVMATRSGAIDPGLVLWLLDNGWSPAQLARVLEHESGLAAFGGGGDMRRVEALALEGDADATLGLEIYDHRLAAYIAAMTATLGGLDVLVFTGGVGEHSARVRSRAGERLHYLGVAIDWERNAVVAGDSEITAEEASVRTVVVEAREDLEIVRLVESVIGA
jgi:acetate kinase